MYVPVNARLKARLQEYDVYLCCCLCRYSPFVPDLCSWSCENVSFLHPHMPFKCSWVLMKNHVPSWSMLLVFFGSFRLIWGLSPKYMHLPVGKNVMNITILQFSRFPSLPKEDKYMFTSMRHIQGNISGRTHEHQPVQAWTCLKTPQTISWTLKTTNLQAKSSHVWCWYVEFSSWGHKPFFRTRTICVLTTLP